MPDYQEIIDSAEEQLLANIKQAQELNLAAVGVMRATHGRGRRAA
jgi:hypothetical protein